MPRKTKVTHKTRLSKDDLKKIEGMAGLRLPNDYIATIMGISKSTYERMLKTNSALRDAVDRGRANFSGKMRNTLAQMATTPGPHQFQAIKFWTMTQEGFRTVERVEHFGKVETTPTTAPQIIITLPSNGREVK